MGKSKMIDWQFVLTVQTAWKDSGNKIHTRSGILSSPTRNEAFDYQLDKACNALNIDKSEAFVLCWSCEPNRP